jgi:ketosteroid isomerase-like protein
MNGSNETDNARELVLRFYEGGARGDIMNFRDSLADNFVLHVPPQLPWGGTFNKQQYVALLPRVASTLDFTRLKFLAFVAEGNHVVALIDIGVAGTDRSVIISEHWDVRDAKAIQLRVAYFDPSILLETSATRASSTWERQSEQT